MFVNKKTALLHNASINQNKQINSNNNNKMENKNTLSKKGGKRLRLKPFPIVLFTSIIQEKILK